MHDFSNPFITSSFCTEMLYHNSKKNVNFFCKLHKYYNICFEVTLMLKSEYNLHALHRKLWPVAYVHKAFFTDLPFMLLT